MAQLVNGGRDPSDLAVLLPGVVSNAVLQGERAASITRIASENRTGGNVTALEMTPEQPHAFRRSGQHDGAFPLPFAEDADLLIIGGEIHIGRQQAKRLSYPNTCIVQEGKKGAVTKI